MFKVFASPLAKLRPDPSLESRALVDKRLALAAAPPEGTADRYVLVPAAAGAEDGLLKLSADPEQMIRGGALNETGTEVDYKVNLVDVAAWMIKNFREEDYVILKSDIEGGEFQVLHSLLDHGKAHLIDKLLLECHPGSGDCPALISRLTEAGVPPQLEGEGGFEGWDSLSSPDLYYAASCR